MTQNKNRTEKDSLGDVQVPLAAKWGAQTQRAVHNFSISELRLHHRMIKALGLIKFSYAKVNVEKNLLEQHIGLAIQTAAQQLINGNFGVENFPVDIFQTGSGTSSNMNANEVIAHLVNQNSTYAVHPNNHVNMSQSSNDVFPSAIHISATIGIHEKLLPALKALSSNIEKKAQEHQNTVKNGRTHLMDAMPVTFAQQMSGWKEQIDQNILNIEWLLPNLKRLALGGTAVGTGVNVTSEIAKKVCLYVRSITDIQFVNMPNLFFGLACQDSILAISGQLNTLATSLIKIANDLRWMNSGPLMGLGEIQLKPLQPGSSIMPGKVNPVIPEAAMMVGAKVMGNHTTISVCNSHGNFELNVMLPVVSHCINESIDILSNISVSLGNDAIASFSVNEKNIQEMLSKNPILVTALNQLIGYEKGAQIAKEAYQTKRSIIEVAKEQTDMSDDDLKAILDPMKLTQGGIFGK